MVRVIQEYKIHRELNDKWKYFIPDNEKKILTTKKKTIHYGNEHGLFDIITFALQ